MCLCCSAGIVRLASASARTVRGSCDAAPMTRAPTAADRAVDAILREQRDLITRPQALAAGLTDQILRRRVSMNGRWQIVLPGI